ncbi:antitoxin [Roseomonas mucosa]|uniref:antitoxin n=1 Tax=Roseomonas mucosa TaxID=207340 RepID=UPI003251A821
MSATPLQTRHVRLFRNNRNQAVRIPVEFELPGEDAIMTRDGDRLIIEPVRKKIGLVALLAEWAKEPPLAPEDDFPDIPDEPTKPEDVL